MNKLIIVLAFFSSLGAFARLLTLEDASISKLSDETYYIEKNGSYCAEVRQVISILNEEGRDNFGTLSFEYSPETSLVKEISAKTVNKLSETIVTKDQISDKPLAASNSGFDSECR